MKSPIIVLSFLLATVLPACDLLDQEKKATEITLDEKSATLVEENNLFGFSFFEKVLSSEDPNINIMVSPLSVSQALSMALNGANGNTLTQMKEVLGFDDYSTDELNQSNQEIASSLIGHDPKVNMSIANSVWYRKDFSPKKQFITDNKKYYGAEVNSYDPSKPDEAKKAMNNWVEDNTNGKIEEIIEEVSSESVLFLINAIYFKAEWKSKFKKSNTEKAPFTLENGTSKEVETMKGEVDLSYYTDNKYTAIELPYGSGKFNMVVFLPEEGYTTVDIAGVIRNFDFEILKKSTLSKREIWLPKFEFAYKNELNDELVSMGMYDAFDRFSADFSNLSEMSLYISKVMHKAYIKTDEEGSEAAAATSVEFRFTSAGPTEPIKINRSFLFAIVEEDTGAILFVGKMVDPTLNN